VATYQLNEPSGTIR